MGEGGQFSDPTIASTGGGLASEPWTPIGVRDRTNGLAKDKSLAKPLRTPIRKW